MTKNLPVLVDEEDAGTDDPSEEKLLAVVASFDLPVEQVADVRNAMVEFGIGTRAVGTYLKKEVTVPQMLVLLEVRDRVVSEGLAVGETLSQPSHACMLRFVDTFNLREGAESDELTRIITDIRDEMMHGDTRYLQQILDHLVEQSKHYPGFEPLVLAKALMGGIDVENADELADVED